MRISTWLVLTLNLGLVAFTAHAQANVPSSSEGASLPADVVDGPRLPNYKDFLKSTFADATEFNEIPVLPFSNGGSSFMGLVHRLLGEQVQREHEGLKTRRFIYEAFNEKKELLGLAHRSSFELNGKIATITVIYDGSGQIRRLDIEGLPSATLAELNRGSYIDQFSGRSSEDFEVTLGRRGRIKSRGAFFTQARRPGESSLRNAFDRIFRSVRFNTAFMEIAYFVIRHPEEMQAAPFENAQLFRNPFSEAEAEAAQKKTTKRRRRHR